MKIEHFRELKDVEIKIGNKLTVISGRNGTGKSSILGLIAQSLSFRNVGELKNIHFKTLFGEDFESEFKNHMKISNKFDTPDKKYKIDIKLKNDSNKYALTSTKRQNQIRFVLRGNEDRNFTHPCIFLDLRRLTPMVYRKEALGKEIDISAEDKLLLVQWTNDILPKIEASDNISQNLPEKDIKSVVATSKNYDIKVASAGEDNVGQILISLLSFKKLKDNYEDYKGGILLIDELDATLFPLSQKKMLDLLLTLAGKYDLQIIFTTHSPTILNYVYEKRNSHYLHSKTKDDLAVNYLTNSKGVIENLHYENVADILGDLEYKINSKKKKSKGTLVNVYCEDEEARDMLKKILPISLRRKLDFQNNVSLGAEQYESLIKANVSEFKYKSIIVLDGDKTSKYKNVVSLPFELPPDRLVYKYLCELPADDKYWDNNLNYTKSNFSANNKVNLIRTYIEFKNGDYILKENVNKSKNVREYFKEFYQDDEIKELLSTAKCNVFTILKNEYKKEVAEFVECVEKCIEEVEKNMFL